MTPDLRDAICAHGVLLDSSPVLLRIDRAINTLVTVDAQLAVVTAALHEGCIADTAQCALMLQHALTLLPGVATTLLTLSDLARKADADLATAANTAGGDV